MPFQQVFVFILLCFIKHAFCVSNFDKKKARELFQKGMVSFREPGKGNWERTKKLFDEADSLDPDFDELQLKYGHGIASQENDYASALEWYLKCIATVDRKDRKDNKAKENLAVCLEWAGVSYRRIGKMSEGIPYLQRAAKEYPTELEIHYNLGYSLFNSNRYSEALLAFEKRLSTKPFYSETGNKRDEREKSIWYMARIALMAGEWDMAIQLTDMMAKLRHNQEGLALLWAGYAYLQQKKTRESDLKFLQATQANSNNGITKKSLKGRLRQLSDEVEKKTEKFRSHFDENGRDSFEHVEKVINSISIRFFHMVDSGDLAYWNTTENPLGVIDSFSAEITKQRRRFKRTDSEFVGSIMQLPPLKTIRLPFTLQQSLSTTQAYVEYYLKGLPNVQRYNLENIRSRYTTRKSGKIKVGFISSDIRQHPAYQVVRGIFEYYDKKKFEVTIFLLYEDFQVMDQIRSWVDKVVNIEFMGILESLRAIQQEEIDVLVDLNLYTGHGRPHLIARKPAPVIINYCGYPGTSGGDFIDYMLTDIHAVPPQLATFYSEKLIYLPHTWLINNHKSVHNDILNQKKLKQDVSRAMYNLPENKIVFANFGQHYKMDIHWFDTVCYILKHVPNSIIWLIEYSNSRSVPNLKKEFWSHGISPELRVRFTKKISDGEHIKAASLADLFLDTPKYNGGMTSVDTLWSGTPFITMPGEQHKIMQRAGVSLAHALEMPEMIVDSYKEYGDRAIRLGKNPKELTALRSKLESKRVSAPLYNNKQNANDIMTAVDLAWQAYFNEDDSNMLFVPGSKSGQTKKEKRKKRKESSKKRERNKKFRKNRRKSRSEL